MTPKPTIRAARMWRIIGDRVRIAREEADMPSVVLALTARVSRQTLENIEHGKKGARLEVLYRIAKATGNPIDYFLPPTEDV